MLLCCDSQTRIANSSDGFGVQATKCYIRKELLTMAGNKCSKYSQECVIGEFNYRNVD